MIIALIFDLSVYLGSLAPFQSPGERFARSPFSATGLAVFRSCAPHRRLRDGPSPPQTPDARQHRANRCLIHVFNCLRQSAASFTLAMARVELRAARSRQIVKGFRCCRCLTFFCDGNLHSFVGPSIFSNILFAAWCEALTARARAVEPRGSHFKFRFDAHLPIDLCFGKGNEGS